MKNISKVDIAFEGRSYKHYDKQDFSKSISSKNWPPFYDAHTPSGAWKEMLNIITEEADRQCPIKHYKIRNSKPSWLTNELIEQMKDRDYFYQKAKKMNDEDDWNIAKFHRNQVNFNIRKAKADYIKDQLTNNEGNSARFWRSIKKIMPNKKGSRNYSKISIYKNDDELAQETEVADIMNGFFANIGNKRPQASKDNNPRPSPDVTKLPNDSNSNNLNDEKMDILPILRQEVEALIRKINISKSSGIELLSSRILKDSFLVLSNKLTYLFNLSIQSSTFPSQWKKALVIPIPKSGNPNKKENYRPISLLPLPGKILEKLIHNQLSYFIEENNLLTDNQYGFRKQRSTSHAISQVLHQIYSNMNRSAITAAVYIDFSKAFNCVQHSTLLCKLGKMNLSPKTIQWIASYLVGREQRTLVNGTHSTSLPVNQGVPQGSVLGPLFYIIYSNDIIEKVKKSGFTFYADDTVIYSKKKSLEQAGADIQEDLDGLSQWCTQNDLFMNVSKTKVMFYGSKAKINSIDLPEFYINGQPIDRAKTYTYLGIKLDEQLSLDIHANLLIRKVSNKIYQLSKIRSFITKKAALMIYKNMILPILEYGDVFIHSASKETRKKLQVLQNKALRCALSKEKLFPTDELHVEAKLLKLKDRRHMHVLLHMYQLAQMPNFKLWKTHQPNGVRTRSSKKKLITFRRPTMEKYRKSITYQGPKLWNNLPAQVQKLDTYHEFKSNVKKMFQPSKKPNLPKATLQSAKNKNGTQKNSRNKTQKHNNRKRELFGSNSISHSV